MSDDLRGMAETLRAAMLRIKQLTGELAPLSGRGGSLSGRYGSAVKTRWSGRSPSMAVAR
jgi:hypothetical protein